MLVVVSAILAAGSQPPLHWFGVVMLVAFFAVLVGIPFAMDYGRQSKIERVLRERGFVVFRGPGIRMHDLAAVALGPVRDPGIRSASPSAWSEEVRWIAMAQTAILAEYRFRANRRFSEYSLVGVIMRKDRTWLPEADESRDYGQASPEEKGRVRLAMLDSTRRMWGNKPTVKAVLRMLDEMGFYGLCANCGYDMTGLKANVCPECGKTAEPDPRVV